jgi:murein DD-endopeptidase MepM/ murein hydrolase activator NlpD
LSRHDELPVRPWDGPATAAQAAVGVLPRPRPAVPAPRKTGSGTAPGSPVTGDWRLAPVDWDRDWADSQSAGDADDEYLDLIDLPTPDGAALDGPAPVEASPAAPAAASRSTLRRRLPTAPRRRPAVLLAAVVAGALIAAGTGLVGIGGAASTASAQDYGLGVEESGFGGGVDVAGARGEISQAEAQARLNEIIATRAARQPEFVMPTQGRMSTCFCARWGTMHWGIDLAAPLGTPILAAADGVVLRAGPATGYGNAIYIQDADGNVEIYGHMRYLFVHAGDIVSAGDTIAKVGSEGQSTGPHLHFEIHVGGMSGKPTDPQKWLADRGISVG